MPQKTNSEWNAYNRLSIRCLFCFSGYSTYIAFASFLMISDGNPLFSFPQNFLQSLDNFRHFGLVDKTDIKFNDAVIGLVFARVDRRILRF